MLEFPKIWGSHCCRNRNACHVSSRLALQRDKGPVFFTPIQDATGLASFTFLRACRFWGKGSWWCIFCNDPNYCIPISVHGFVFYRRFYYLRCNNMRARARVCVIRTFLAFPPIFASDTVCIPLPLNLCVFSFCLVLFFLLLYFFSLSSFLTIRCSVFLYLFSSVSLLFLSVCFYFSFRAIRLVHLPMFVFVPLIIFPLFRLSPILSLCILFMYFFLLCLFLSLSLVYFSFFPSKRVRNLGH
jgi:hypothetical protein